MRLIDADALTESFNDERYDACQTCGMTDTKEYVYCAVNSNGEIQWVSGSSSHTRYYLTDTHVKKAVEYHNKYHQDDLWHVSKFELVLQE